jgi:hypothetical protein
MRCWALWVWMYLTPKSLTARERDIMGFVSEEAMGVLCLVVAMLVEVQDKAIIRLG